MNRYKASLYNFLFNSVNSVIVIINGIIMVPLYFHFFPVSVYGAWLASGNLVAMIGLLESGFSSVITQKMAEAISHNDNVEYRTLAGSNIISAIILSLSIFLIGLILSPFIANIVNVESSYSSDITIAFILSALSASIMIFVSLFGAFPQVWQETKQVGLINTGCNIAGIVSLVIYLFLGFGVISLGLSYVTRSLCNLIFQGRWILKRWQYRNDGKVIFSWPRVISLSKACIYPFLSKISNVFMGQSTSLIIAAFLNPTLAAIFDLTGKIATCMMGFLSMANGSFFALLSLTISQGNKKEILKIINRITCFVSVLVVGAIIYSVSFSEPIMYWWVGLDKYGGDWLLIAIVLSTAITQYKSFLNNILFTSGNINRASMLDILCLIVYSLLLLSTLWKFGIYSIPISMAASNLLFISLYIKAIQNNLKISLSKAISYIIRSFLFSLPIIIYSLVTDTKFGDFYIFSISFIFISIYFIMYILVNSESRELVIKHILKKH